MGASLGASVAQEHSALPLALGEARSRAAGRTTLLCARNALRLLARGSSDKGAAIGMATVGGDAVCDEALWIWRRGGGGASITTALLRRRTAWNE